MLHSGREMAAIQSRKNSILIIKGDGKLIAYGGEGAAGIGCGYATECGDIIIESGTIEAYAGYQYETSWRAGSAGIGGAGQYAGRKSKCGNITITGGKIMAAISELIRTEGNGTLSFGDYTLGAKAKLDNYEFHGDKYKVKTFKEITKLERNGLFVYESVPGTAVTNFTEDENTVSFTVEGPEDAQITLELAEETEYEIDIDGKSAGTMKTNLGGKLSLSVELEGADAVAIRVEKR